MLVDAHALILLNSTSMSVSAGLLSYHYCIGINRVVSST